MVSLRRSWFNVFLLLAIAASSVNANCQVKADFTATPVTGCPPMVVFFKDLSKGDGLTYYWDLGNGTISYLQHPTATYFDPGKYTVKLKVKNASGTDSLVRSQYIVVNAPPTVDFKASDSTGCYPLRVSFKEFSTAGSGTITSYEWDFGDGSLSNEQTPVHTYINAGTFTVTLRVYNSNGCVKVFTKPSYIKLEDGVKANFTYMSAAGCQPPAPVTFTNKSSGTGALSYKWLFGDGNSSTAKDPVHEYKTAGAYTIKLIVTNSSGCADTITKANAINIGFVKADFTRPDTACAGAAFSIRNTSAPNTMGSYWVFSDGTTSTTTNPSKRFSVPGTYTIKVVNDFGSCKDSITKTIVIISKPAGGFTASNNTGCKLPLTVNFQNTTTDAVKYLWDFGDGTASAEKDPTHTYKDSGAYTVKLITTNSNGCTDTATKPGFVNIVKPKILTVNKLPAKGCIPFSVSPSAVVQSTQPITSYFWDFGDGATSTSATPTHTYTVSGKYEVKLIVSTASGCSDTLVMKPGVQVGTKPVPKFSGTPLDICAETAVNFKDLTDGVNHEWFWDFGDGSTSTEQHPIHNYTDTGYFNVLFVVYNFGCADSVVKKNYVHVVPPIAAFDTSFVCSDRLTRNFINKSIGATSWNWDFGDGTKSTLKDPPPHKYASSGVYTVYLKVGNGVCEHNAKMLVNVINEKGKFFVGDSSACRSSRVLMDVTGINNKNIQDYSWFFNGFDGPRIITQNAPVSQTYREPGIFTVGAIVTDLFGCRDTLKGTLPVKIYGSKVDFFAPYSGTCVSNAVNFIDSSKSDGINQIKQWTWDYGDGKKETYTAPPFIHKYDTTGVFDVTLKIVDGYGCRDSITKQAVISISKVILNYTISDTVLCPGTPLVVTNSSIGAEVKYKWDFGDGNTSAEYSPTHIYNKEGNFTIKMVMTDKYGCSDSLSYKVKVFNAKAAFLMSDSFSSCPPLKVNFTNQSQNFTSFQWDFGDGGISNLQNPQHIYTYAGTYTVKLWVKNNGGCTDTLKKVVTIQGPSGVFKYVPTAVCSPDTINFTATTKNTVNYIWDFNDGNTISSTQTTASHIYAIPGRYIPKMILQDASGCQVPVIGTDTIIVNAIKTEIHATNKVTCENGSASFFDSTTTNDAIGSFKWHFGDGDSSVERNPVHIYKKPGYYTIRLVATSVFGCTDTAMIQDFIKVSNRPAIAITGDTSGCAPTFLTFNGVVTQPDTSALKWNWSFGNSQVSTLQNPPSQTYQNAGSYPVRASVVNSNGCIAEVSRLINIHAKPVIDVGPDLVTCKDLAVSLVPMGAETYVWDSHPTLSCLDCESPTAKPSTRTVYRVTGKTEYGCTNSDTIAVNIMQPVNLMVSKNDSLCLGSSYKLNASGADKYFWSPSTYLDNPLSSTPTAKPDSTITYRVIGKDSINCFADTGFITLKVQALDVFIQGDSSVCEFSNLAYKGSTKNSGNALLTWKWEFSNGIKSDKQNPDILKVTPAGTYNIKLNVTTNTGCGGFKEMVTVVNPVPKVEVEPDTILCRFAPLTLHATGADTYVWDPQPSLSCLNCATPVANPTAKTFYKVTGKTTFGCTNTDSLYVSVIQPVNMDVGKGDSMCLGSSHKLYASGADKYEWTPSVYLDNATSATPTSKPDSTIVYRVIGKDSLNCFADTGYVLLKVAPLEIGIEGETTACEPANLLFSGKTSDTDPSLNWKWEFGNGMTSASQNPETQLYRKAGKYPVKLTVVNDKGCVGVREKIVQVNPLPDVYIGADTIICKFSPLSLQATGADNYTWDFKPSLSCLNCSSPIAKPDSTATYAVTGRTVFGCTARDSITVKVNQPFKMDVGKGDTLCIGENSMLWASGAQVYSWMPSASLDNPLSARTKANPNSTITYQVIGKDSIGCFADTGKITVHVYPKPKIDIIGGAAITLNAGGKLTLHTNNTADITKWVWAPARGLSCTACPNPVATPTETTTYTVTATNPGGCLSADEVIITVVCNDRSIYIPNTFSPNSDGSNDVFFPRSSANLDIKMFRVFNRWGQLVYQKSNFASNSSADGWDGTMNGVKLLPDVYVYLFEVVCGTGAVIPIKGNVTLIR